MRKAGQIILAGMLGAMIPMTVCAATEEKDVWISPNTVVENDSELEIEVQTNGKTTDGLLHITYNPEIVSCGEEQVTFAEGVDVYSVYVVEPGSLKIAYLSEDVVEEGSFIYMKFSYIKEGGNTKDPELNMTGEVHDASGKDLTAGVKEMPDTEPEEKPDKKPEVKPEGTTDKKTDGETVGTGDETSMQPIL